ncbi:DNA cytosine methyltransferase [Streptomyces sp. SID6648]|nr:DNA cytosine methyltransferase [Streptomyces sp. SID6648]
MGDVRFRMLEPHEIGAAMAFPDTYIVTGSKRDKVRKYGNAVTPPVAEVIVSALVEAVTGEPLEVAW